ncbi:MAG: hypothetical protein WAL04_16750 [Acidimicrobiales bacterium]
MQEDANGRGAGPAPLRPPAPGAPVVVACLKLVELRAAVDPLTGAVTADPVSAGPSAADEAALEWALRIAETAGAEVVALCAGGTQSETMLLGALAAGAARALRVPLNGGESSAVVAAALAAGIRSLLPAARSGSGSGSGAASGGRLSSGSAAGGGWSSGSADGDGSGSVLVCCGDASVDRGSGSVPAFLAAELAAAQALGLIGLSLPAAPEANHGFELEVERRLDRGRRERLRLRPPCVVSVEAATARLRRATLAATLAARTAKVVVLDGALDSEALAGSAADGVELVAEEPFRPRTRVVPPPAGPGARERILDLTGSLQERPAARTLVLEPEAAADALLSTLAEWGELPEGVATGPRVSAQDGDDGYDETEAS